LPFLVLTNDIFDCMLQSGQGGMSC
jgi:hypothetical protein